MKHLLKTIRPAGVTCVVLVTGMIFSGVRAESKPTEKPTPVRSLKICVAANADPQIQQAAQSVLAAVGTQPLLQTMGKENAPQRLSDSVALMTDKPEERAYSHLVVIGLPDDPLIQALWQRDAKVEAGGLYIFGWGHLRGDVGYVESARNPFLHSELIPSIPFETEAVILTGTTPKGVQAAVEAFLKSGLVNGVVAASGWTRGAANLLDRDPISPQATPPTWVPGSAGKMKRIATLAGSEDEYRGVLADAGREPLEIWRIKYLGDEDWDCGTDYKAKASQLFEAGLHRRASGNMLWLARFGSAKEAADGLHQMAGGAKFVEKNGIWYGDRPGFSRGPSAGPIALWQHGEWLLMSTLPEAETVAITTALLN